MMITAEERVYLRELAEEFKQASETQKNNEKRKAWYNLNDLKEGTKPLFINHYWPVAMNEIFPKESFKCTSPRALEFEKYFKTKLFYVNVLKDDNVVEPVVYSNLYYTLEDYTGMQRIKRRAADDDGTGAFEMVPTIIEEEDIKKFTSPTLTYDKEKTYEDYLFTKELFDGILTTIKTPVNFATKISDEYSWYRGMENTYYDVYDNPEWMHEILQKISDNYDERFDKLEDVNLLGCLDQSYPLGSAGLRYATGVKDFRDVKNGDYFNDHSTTHDNWGFTCAEVFNCVSNEVHDEFTFQYDIKAMSRFKYCNVGCCEVLDKKIDLIRQFPNARKISVSEWCNYETAAKAIEGDYVYSYRAAGVHFMGAEWDKVSAEKEIRGVLEASKKHNCKTEIVLNIGGTLNGSPVKKVTEWSQMVRDLIEEYYG